MTRAKRRRTATAVFVTAAVGIGIAAGSAAPAVASPSGGCPALYVLGVPGTGEIGENSSTTTDSGMLSAVMTPLLTLAGSSVQRAYVPYPASFGGATGKGVAGKGTETFEQSALAAVARTKSMIEQVVKRCGDSKFALAGYSQGAYAASLVTKEIAGGKGPISADRLLAVSLMGDPTRPAGSGLFPGADGQSQPAPAPGTNGTAVRSLPQATQTPTTGGGIGPVQDSTAGGYGVLSGRVVSWCSTGDLACDAPSGSPVVHLVTNIAGQSKLDPEDPVQTLGSLAEALALTTVKAAVPIINEDVSGDTVENLSYRPSVTLSQRLATASDPRTPMPNISDALNAVLKVGTIAFNAVVTVAKKVFTPDTIAKLAATGLTDPPAALMVLAGKALEATVELVPPSTASRWADEAFEAVKQNISDNAELLDVSNLVRYWKTAQQHTSYGQGSPALGGLSPARYTAMWFAAVAADLTGKSFRPTDSNGVWQADTSPTQSPAVVPTVPGAGSSSTTTPSSLPFTVPRAPMSSEAPSPTTESRLPSTTAPSPS